MLMFSGRQAAIFYFFGSVFTEKPSAVDTTAMLGEG
jgi:hypothetical protein